MGNTMHTSVLTADTIRISQVAVCGPWSGILEVLSTYLHYTVSVSAAISKLNHGVNSS